MENLLRPYDKEYIRMAMLKHEETFKQQVYELHCLYRIQETLMRSIEIGRPNGSFSMKNTYQHRNINMHHDSRTRHDHLEHPAGEADYQRYNVAESGIEEIEIELTLGPTKYRPEKKHRTPLTSDSGPSFSSSSNESSHMKHTSTREDFSGNDDRMGLFHVTGSTLRYQNGSKNNNELGEELRPERLKPPPWLFQVLSMNMTRKQKGK
ncbi:uncharacterized protein LOC120166494 [Hibiscus syriacus]|uniref:uncharacterized protein LOC120166494 n=1 Tax=Hibiscus syriacus TaxID=106335 RepID=UPI001924EF1B|nr:uncharacterized protein LOC120166494 [Hibiscus syriacus]XP_039031756.1 uncharacterized protein LOC120166494 [Hibiscus syriacus]